jgi:uncharacterized tellurite resistance protein B-like protein
MQDMLERLMKALSGDGSTRDEVEDAGRVAIAALLVEAARSDDVYVEDERRTIDRVLAGRFGLTGAEAEALRVQGEAAQAEAVDLVRFTRAIKEAVPYEERVGVIEALWRVILADDEIGHEESGLVRQLARLLYVSDPDAGLARQRVAGTISSHQTR